jgi:hypothetical protein
MSVTGFNRRRRELAAQQEAEEAAKLEAQKQEADEQNLAEELETAPGDLDDMPYPELRALAKEREIEGYHKMNTEELREALKEGG